MRSLATFVGRLLLCGIFVYALAGEIHRPEYTTDLMKSAGMPVPILGLVIAIILAVAGCLSLILGFWTRLGALLLILYLIPASYYFHDFWSHSGTEATQEATQFLKNVGLAGGLLLLIAHGPGWISLDARKKRKRAKAAKEAESDKDAETANDADAPPQKDSTHPAKGDT